MRAIGGRSGPSLRPFVDLVKDRVMSSEQKRDAVLHTLKERGLVGADALSRASRLADDAGESITSTLTRLGLVSEEDLAEALSASLQIDRMASHALHQLQSVLISAEK